MRYGYFDDEHREYVITQPDTPLPWINYLGSGEYISLISNTAAGYSFYRDARLRRLIRYRYNNAPLDVGGRFIYVRDDAAPGPEPVYWSPTWMPTRRRLDAYECRHGLGYTRIASRSSEISSTIDFFVPLDENLEIWRLTVKNERSREARLSVFSAVEFCLWDALDDATNLQRNLSIGEVEAPDLGSPDSNREPAVIIHKTEYRERRNHYAYFACSVPTAGFETDRESFLGPYRGWDAPGAVEAGKTGNSVAHGWQPVGVHHAPLTIGPGETSVIVFALGYAENPNAAKFESPGSTQVNRLPMKLALGKYLAQDQVDDARRRLREHWEERLLRLQVNTPDGDANRIINIWNPYQTMTTFNVSRSASFYETGTGRGIGFRDSSQDLLGYVHLIPAAARQRLLDLAATQLESGGAFHQYQPLTKRGNDTIGSGFNDDPLWLVVAAGAYIRETGDWDILSEPVVYENQPGTEAPLYEHLSRCIQYTLERRGPHGLPLIGRADWNDCLNLNCFSETPGESFQTTVNKQGEVAESVFIAGLFVLASKEMADLARHWPASASFLPKVAVAAEQYDHASSQMESAITAHGWAGDWFLRAYDDSGRPVGSPANDEGRIFIEPQGICIMAGLGLGDGRAARALDAVEQHLATRHGIMLVQPPFTRYQLHLGEISSYPPGYKENGSIFCHSNPWIMIAEAILGRGDRAFDYYRRINPSVREEISEVHRCEPYVYAQMIAGRDAPTHGEAKNSWLTGSAAWNYVAFTQWILGLRPTHSGLLVDPCIPATWDGFEAVRYFRGSRFEVIVRNPRHVHRGIRQLTVDGHPVEGKIIPLALAVGTHRVEAELGN